MHGAERRDDLRDLGWEIRRGSIERLPEGSAGEQAEQHLDALVVDEGRGQHLEQPAEARR